MSVSTTWWWVCKWLAVDSFLIQHNKVYPVRGNTMPLKSKNNYFMWYRPISISNVQPNCCQICLCFTSLFKRPPKPWTNVQTFSIHPVCMDVLIKWLFFIKWVSRHPETKLKNNFPSTFRRAIWRKSEMLDFNGVLTLGMQTSLALCHWSGISHLLKEHLKILKRYLLNLGHFLYSL